MDLKELRVTMKAVIIACLLSVAFAVKVPYYDLLNGQKMPALGLGTYKATGDKVYHAVKWALQDGYRLIDTADLYGNHKEIGKALKEVFAEGKIKREEVFITTKVWKTQMTKSKTHKFIDHALHDLGLKYIDLVLIHFPEDNYLECYKALEEEVDKGRIKGIGLSNFDEDQCNDVWTHAKHKPVNLQVLSAKCVILPFKPHFYLLSLL